MLSVSQYAMLEDECGIQLYHGGNPAGKLRYTKSNKEIAVLQQAAGITDECTEHLVSFIKPGMTEWEVVTEMTRYYMSRGCRGTSFEPIVASGAGSSMPHYRSAVDKILEDGDVLLIDMGCEFNGYNSDLTRTFFLGFIDPEIERIYTIVNEAREKAVNRVVPGISAGEVDAAARDHIVEAGFGDYFGHSLGHGVGLDVHEAPRVKPEGDEILQAGTVITIEPGIYLPGKGGVRIEDMVAVTEAGAQLMTHYPRDIKVL